MFTLTLLAASIVYWNWQLNHASLWNSRNTKVSSTCTCESWSRHGYWESQCLVVILECVLMPMVLVNTKDSHTLPYFQAW